LPVLLLVVTGICTFGLAYNNYLQLTEATSVGARQLSLSRNAALADPCASAASAVYAAAPLLKQGSLTFNIAVYTSSSASTTYTTPSCPSAPLTQAQPVTLTVNYPCSVKAFDLNSLPACNLRSQVTEVVQ
jgi:Flp pilus assembly protein TadG